MTCRKFRKLLNPWLDGELKPEQAKELQNWVDNCEEVRQCSECRKLIDEHRSFHRLFNSLPQTEFPAFLHHRIMDKIKSREPLYHKKAVRIRWQTVPATIAIILGLYVGTLVGISTFHTQTTRQTETSDMYSFGESSVVNHLYTIGEFE